MKKKTLALVVSIVLAASCLVLPFPVNAAHRAIIVPKDYSTIEDAINAASNGDTVFISRGNYEGFKNQTLVINKTITLVGEAAETTRLHLDPPFVLMNIFTFFYMGYSDAIRVRLRTSRF